AGYQQVFVFGDMDAGVDYLIGAIAGTPAKASAAAVEVTVGRAGAIERTPGPAELTAAITIRTNETPVGVASSPDGQTLYAALYDGSVVAHSADGAEKWRTQALREGAVLALSPKGDRLVVAGYPGVKVLDTA